MTTKIIELKQAPVILVELPEGAHNLQIFNDVGRPYLSYYTKPVNTHRAYLPDGEHEILGFLSNLTEEQFAERVSKPHFAQIFSKRLGPFYTDYTNQGRNMMSAKYSWVSLLESEQVYVGPVEEPQITDYTVGQLSWYNEDLINWKEAQSRTIDPNRTVVLLRKEGE